MSIAVNSFYIWVLEKHVGASDVKGSASSPLVRKKQTARLGTGGKAKRRPEPYVPKRSKRSILPGFVLSRRPNDGLIRIIFVNEVVSVYFYTKITILIKLTVYFLPGS